MSANADLQDAVTAVLGMTGRLRAGVDVISRRTKERAKEIEAATARKSGLCIFVMPPLPTRAMQSGDEVFIEASTIRVRIVENPAVSAHFGADAYDLMDDVMLALHWEPKKSLDAAVEARMIAASEDLATAAAWVFAQTQYAPLVALATVLTAHPMYLRATPVEMVEDPATRLLDVLFECQYGLLPPA